MGEKHSEGDHGCGAPPSGPAWPPGNQHDWSAIFIFSGTPCGLCGAVNHHGADLPPLVVLTHNYSVVYSEQLPKCRFRRSSPGLVAARRPDHPSRRGCMSPVSRRFLPNEIAHRGYAAARGPRFALPAAVVARSLAFVIRNPMRVRRRGRPASANLRWVAPLEDGDRLVKQKKKKKNRIGTIVQPARSEAAAASVLDANRGPQMICQPPWGTEEMFMFGPEPHSELAFARDPIRIPNDVNHHIIFPRSRPCGPCEPIRGRWKELVVCWKKG